MFMAKDRRSFQQMLCRRTHPCTVQFLLWSDGDLLACSKKRRPRDDVPLFRFKGWFSPNHINYDPLEYDSDDYHSDESEYSYARVDLVDNSVYQKYWSENPSESWRMAQLAKQHRSTREKREKRREFEEWLQQMACDEEEEEL